MTRRSLWLLSGQNARPVIAPSLLTLAVAIAGCITLTPSLASAQAGTWLRGDLHMHSTHSDGDSPPSAVIDRAVEQGLDFIALTDHDTSMNGSPTHWSDPGYVSDDLILLYGVEWTSGLGHANVWAPEPFDYSAMWEANRAQDADAAIRAAHDQGALFSINHPAAYGCCAWEYDNLEPADAVEVWNGTYRVPGFNGQATHVFWDARLTTGRTPTAVGGSDTHYLGFPQQPFWTIGNPTTWVYASTPNARAILQAIRAGHVSVSYEPDAPRIELSADIDGDGRMDAMMGDAIPGGGRVDFLVRLVDPDNTKTSRRATSARPVNRALVDALAAGRATPLEVYRAALGEKDGSSCNGHLLIVFRSGSPYHAAALPCGSEAYGFHDTPYAGSYYRVEAVGFPDDLKPIQHPLHGTMTAVSNPIYVD